MKRPNTIFLKFILLLTLTIGWGGSVYADSYNTANKWYRIRMSKGYLNSDQVTAEQYLKFQNSTSPDNYSGIWCFEETGNTAKNDGVNVLVHNAKFLDTQVLAVGGNMNGNGNSARAKMFAPDAIEANYYAEVEKRMKSATQAVFRVEWTGNDNSYFNALNATPNCLAIWHSGAAYNDGNSQIYIEEVPNMGEDVRVVVNVPAGVTVRFNTQSDVLAARFANVRDVEMTSQAHFNFHNMPFLASLFTAENAGAAIPLFSAFNETSQTLILTTTDPYLIQFSSAPVDGQWADDTKWFSIRNNRAARMGYMSTQDSGNYLDAQGNLTIMNGADASGDRGGLWTFVTNGSGINIYNNAYGPDFILGITGSDGGARMKMYPKDDIPGGVTTLFSTTESNVKAGFSHCYCFVLGTSGSNHLNDQSGGYPGTWNPNNVNTMKGDEGSSFRVEAIDESLVDALPQYDVYKSSWKGAAPTGSITYTDGSKTFGRRGSANDGDYLILQAGSPVAPTDFTIALDEADYEVQSVTPKAAAGHHYQMLNFLFRDKKATEEWTIRVNGGYTVEYAGTPYEDGEQFYLRPGVTPQAVNLAIVGADSKFVWGPVIDAKAKTVTYEVRDRAEELTTGWYQLQVTNNAVSGLLTRIKSEEGSINTRANTLYLAPTLYDAGTGKDFKVTGVPTYAGESSTFIYIVKNGDNNYTLVNPRTGESLTGNPFTFSQGVLTKSSGWSYENHPVEGPYLRNSGSESMSFTVSSVDVPQYKIYQLNFAGSGASSVQGVTLNNSDVLGSKTVKNHGYIFMPATSNTPTAQQFRGVGGTVNKVEIGEAVDGIIPVTVTLSVQQTYWRVHITGDKQATDRVVYNEISYQDEALVALPKGYTPTALDFKTNVTDRFVWGPVFNHNLQTVTFEMKTPVDVTAGSGTPLTTDGWYQFMLVPNGDNASFINTINNASTGRKSRKGSYLYLFNADNEFLQTPSNYYAAKYAAVPASGDQATSFFYVQANGGTPQFQSINGHYIDNSGISRTTPSNSRGLNVIAAQNIYGVKRWSNYNTGSDEAPYMGAAGEGENFYVRAVKVDPTALYDVYQVVLPSGESSVKYTGTEGHGISTVFNEGWLFLTQGTVPTQEHFRLTTGTPIESISISGNVLTIHVPSTTIGKEIVHRQARYYDELEDEPNLPVEGFIQKGEGMTTRQGVDGEGNPRDITEQNMAVFEIPVYLKQGTTQTSYMPTDQVKRYQRWYNWDTDGQVDPQILTSLSGWNVSAANTYTNGHLTGAGYGGFQGTPTLGLPAPANASDPGITHYNVGLDMAHYPTRGTVGSNGALVEPTLAMRIVYQVRDAKIIAKAIKDSTAHGTFYETHSISFPNVKRGRLDDKTIGNLMPLDMDLNNYWIFNGSGETNADLQQVLQSGGATLHAEQVTRPGDPVLQHVQMINGTANAASGNINYSSFNTGHFVLFQYPDGGKVPAGSEAIINVYIDNEGGTQRQNLAQFRITFIGNSEPVAVTELGGSHRHPDALREAFGAPVAELTFDNKTNNEYGGFYKYPLNYEGVSYAFGTMVQGGGHTGWFASRGEYGIGTEYQASAALSADKPKFYPLNNYLRNMSDASASFGANEADSYCLYIDAADQPGKVASIALEDALCAGSRLYCYGYIGCTSGGSGQNPTSILINVMGIDKDTNKEVLIYSYCPGIITLQAYDENNNRIYTAAMGRGSCYDQQAGGDNYWAPWQQVGFSFAIDAQTASQMKSYSVQIVNNAWNSNGADTMLDDFEIFVKKPGAEVQNTTPLCSDQIRHIKVITEYSTLLEATGSDTNGDGLMHVGFCFLDKEVYDQALIDYAANVALPRNNPENTYNKAFGLALMGNRTLDRNNKDHAFHNFNIIRDGAESTINGDTRVRYYTDIPQYSFKESDDDMVYRDSIRGERYIVFKESVAHGEPSGLETHKWTAGKKYYLLFSTATISESHVNNRDLGCTVFNLDDNRCAVLHEFTVAPPVSIKGDVEEITSGDEVQACAGQTATLTVNLNGRTESKDVIIKNLNYDWWMGYVSHHPMELEYGVPKYYDSEGHVIYNGDPDVEYNTLPATLQNYQNIWHGTYKQDNVHLGKKAGDKIYLCDALLEFRRAYPNAADLVGVVPVHRVGDIEEYELTQDMIDCIAHFLQPEPESGYTPLVLMKKEMNLSLGIDAADEHKVVHFVVIPIAPGIYSVDEDAIYCPDPQELRVKLLNESPTLANGFNNMTYPESMSNVPLRVGLQQLHAVRQRNGGTQNTLSVPLRKAAFAYPEKGMRLVKTLEPEIFIVGTDDPAYKRTESNETDLEIGNDFSDTDIDELFVSAGSVEVLAVEKGAANPTMQITFNPNVVFREGYTYTLKVKYYEVMGNDERDEACEGSFVFDMKVVPEYQVWTGATGSTDWTNDQNWARADRQQLHAGNPATGSKMAGATALDDATSYHSNSANTTAGSFVPMYFTNVLLSRNSGSHPILYKTAQYQEPEQGVRFLEGLDQTATSSIVYDMLVTPVNPADRTNYNYDCSYECELFNTYAANGITFEPGAQMGNAHYLIYNKAWVEYELDAGRWYTIGSPLQRSVAGDWYSPTQGGKQLTPHFYDITYNTDRNDRFRPAYYQRSWDLSGSAQYKNAAYQKDGKTLESYISADWSHVYNDAAVNYNAGGFSVKPQTAYMDPDDRPADGKVLVRMPKADESYTYYDISGATGSAADAQIGSRALSSRLLTDALTTEGTGTLTQHVQNGTPDNNYLLLSNPFMAALDMDAFFAQNPDLEAKYWIVTANEQEASAKSGDTWLTTGDADARYVAPLQGFFVKKKEGAQNANTIQATYNAGMQTVVQSTPTQPGVMLKARAQERTNRIRLVAQRGESSSTALIVLQDEAHDGYVAGEDCEAFVDGNLLGQPTVYTSAGNLAQSINVRQSLEMVPVGIISSDDSETTLSFHLDECQVEELYLYDSVADEYTPIEDGCEVSMSGNNLGRYFLTTSCDGDIADSLGQETGRKGVWTVSGIYCGESVQGLTPGIYVVNGVKVRVP